MNDDQLPFEDPTKAYWNEIDRIHELETDHPKHTGGTEPPPATTTLEVFTFEERYIRTIAINGKRWAVAADICASLAIKDVATVMTRIEDADKMLLRRSDTTVSSSGIWKEFAPQVQSVGLVSEDGATDLVLESRKPQARAFRRFLTHTVWPAIRDTGSYSAAPALTDEEFFAQALQKANVLMAAKDARIAEQEQKIVTDAPKVEFYDELMDADGLYAMNTVAKMLGWGEVKLFAELRRRGVLIATAGARHNTPYQKYMHHFDLAPGTYKRKDGSRGARFTTRVRPTGIAFLSKKLGQPILREIQSNE